jgi:hypothetical protein
VIRDGRVTEAREPLDTKNVADSFGDLLSSAVVR